MRRAMKVLGGMVGIVIVVAAAFVAYLYGSQKPNSFLCQYHVGPKCEVGVADREIDLDVPSKNEVREIGESQSFVVSPSSQAGIVIMSDSMVAGLKSAPPATADSERMVVKNGFVSMLVKDVPESVKNISTYASQRGGYVVNSLVYKEGIAPYAEITVRIPAKEFDDGLKGVKAMGELKSENVNGLDVTEEYIDLNSQLTNLLATQERFFAILTEAKKIPDILAVQRELKIVGGEIERIQGRMKYLRLNAELASLTVHLATDPNILPVSDETKVWKPLAEFKDAVRALEEAGKKIANTLIWIVVFSPFWLLALLALWIARKIYRRMSLPRL
ncbi:DUF4349 domain-containing protein [Patescibacteria group bacterium]|nr:DUF4349 domain-containing protein [Patescibacteria group bacterium]